MFAEFANFQPAQVWVRQRVSWISLWVSPISSTFGTSKAEVLRPVLALRISPRCCAASYSSATLNSTLKNYSNLIHCNNLQIEGSMIDKDLVQYCMNDFKRRADAIRAIKLPEIKSITYLFDQINAGVTTQKLRDDFGIVGKARAIYRISVDAENALAMKQVFEARYSDKNRSYNLPRLNQTAGINPTVYIGSSNDLITRLRQHLYRVSSTYALNMGHWINELEKGSLQVDVQLFGSETNNEITQDIEDALWSKYRPMFGRRGSR
ncbi:hypothetical protein ACLBWZ_16520 [Brucellaceae bacterium C25G]